MPCKLIQVCSEGILINFSASNFRFQLSCWCLRPLARDNEAVPSSHFCCPKCRTKEPHRMEMPTFCFIDIDWLHSLECYMGYTRTLCLLYFECGSNSTKHPACSAWCNKFDCVSLGLLSIWQWNMHGVVQHNTNPYLLGNCIIPNFRYVFLLLSHDPW